MPRRPPPSSSRLNTLSPLTITTQILTLQLLYYLCTAGLLLFATLTAGRPFSIDLVLSWRSVRGDTAGGWTLGVCWLLGGGLCGSILLLLLISRSKLVPDFALTLHFFHLVITSLYSRSVPTNWLWWLLQLGSAMLMIAGGMWSCRVRELRPLTFGAGGGVKGVLGRGGEGDGGGGSYEMVARGEEGEGG